MSTTHLLNPIQLECLTSPIRLAILQRLDIDKEATANELARRMGRPVTSLYHHLKQLEAVGLLKVVAERRGPRRPEAVYARISDSLSSAEAVKTEAGRLSYGRTALRVAEAGARAFSAAMERGAPRFEGEHRNAMVRYYLLRANAKTLARLNALLDELDAVATKPGEDGDEIQLTLLLSSPPAKD